MSVLFVIIKCVAYSFVELIQVMYSLGKTLRTFVTFSVCTVSLNPSSILYFQLTHCGR